jgi:hypothetical protein
MSFLFPHRATSTSAQPDAGRYRWLQGLLSVLIAVGCVLRIYNACAHNPMDHLWSDPLRHWDHAKEPLTPSPMAIFDPPLFQIWVSLVQKFTLGVPELVALYATLLSLVTPWCWYRFLRETLASRTLALAGWALLANLPLWIGIYTYIMSETLLLPLIGLSLWMTARAERKLTVQSFVVMVMVWLATGLTRGIAIPMAAAAGGLVWLRHPQKIRTAVYSGLLLVTVLAPLAYRNHAFTYLWAPHGNGWLTKIYAESGRRDIQLHLERDGAEWYYGFTSPSIDSQPFAPLSDWKSSRTGTVHVFVDLKKGSDDWSAALQQSAKHGAERWQLRWENLAYLFFGESWPDDNPRYFMGRMAILARWIWGPLFVLTMAVSLWFWRATLARPLLPAVIAIWFFFQAWSLVAVNEGRYRKPVEGLLIAQVLVLLDARRRRTSAATASLPPDQPVPGVGTPAGRV